MIITTKFDIGNIVYIFINSDIKEYVISGIDTYSISNTEIHYQLKSTSTNNAQTVKENGIFSSKEDAGIAWLKSQGLDCGLKELS